MSEKPLLAVLARIPLPLVAAMGNRNPLFAHQVRFNKRLVHAYAESLHGFPSPHWSWKPVYSYAHGLWILARPLLDWIDATIGEDATVPPWGKARRNGCKT